MTSLSRQALMAALQWHLDAGADEALSETPQGLVRAVADTPPGIAAPDAGPYTAPYTDMSGTAGSASFMPPAFTAPPAARAPDSLGAAEAYKDARARAQTAQTLDELRDALAAFEGLALRKTATNMVFADGHAQAPIMVIGEAPGADEDRLGRPFVGVSGQLLDRILATIGLGRHKEDPAEAVYISNILNWRPPGNRTPTPAEIEVSLPFIERHIALVKPRLLILSGGVSAKALLNRTEGISRLRGQWHNYIPLTPGIAPGVAPIPTLTTYHPSYLLRTPSQKKAVWQDMLILQKKRQELGLLDA